MRRKTQQAIVAATAKLVAEKIEKRDYEKYFDIKKDLSAIKRECDSTGGMVVALQARAKRQDREAQKAERDSWPAPTEDTRSRPQLPKPGADSFARALRAEMHAAQLPLRPNRLTTNWLVNP